jgi:tape measure domain-containing protein
VADLGSASVRIVPDFSGWEREMRSGLQGAMKGTVADAEKAGERIEDAFVESARQSDAAFEKVGGADAFNQAVTSADKAGEAITDHFREAARQSDSALGGISKGAGGLGGLVAGLGLGAAAGLVTKFGLDTAKSLEMTEVGFQGLLGSADGAQQMMAKLTDFAAKTPLELPGLADMTRNLVAQGGTFGVTSDNVLEYVQTIGDMTSVLGGGQGEMDAVTRALGQMGGTGRVTAQDMNQISNALPGFPVWQALADGMGISQAKARELSEDGLIPASEAVPILLAKMKEFPGAAGAMERSSTTLTGVLSTFKDTMGIALAAGLGPLVEGLKTVLSDPALLDTLTQFGNSFGSALGGIFEALGPSIQILVRQVTSILDVMGPALLSFAPLISPIVQIVGVLANVLAEGLGSALIALAPIFGMIGEFLDIFAERLGEFLFGALEAIIPLFDELVRVLTPIFARVLPAILDVFDEFSGVVMRIVEAVLPILVRLFTALAPIVSRLVDAFLMLVDQALSALLPIIDLLLPLFEHLITVLLDALLPVLPQLVEALIAVATSMLTITLATAPLIPPIVQLLDLLIVGLVPILDILAKALVIVAEALAVVTTFISEQVVTVFQFLGEKLQWVVDHLDEVVAFLAETFGPAFEAIVEVVTGVVDDIIEVAGKVVSWFTDTWATISDLLEAPFNTAKETIGNVIDGIKSGFEGAINFIKRIWNTFADFWNGIDLEVPGIDLPFGKTIGGFTIGLPTVPRMASGGLVRATPGGTLALLGEAGRDEAVVPLPAPAHRPFGAAGAGAGIAFNGPVVFGDRRVVDDLDWWVRFRMGTAA